MSGKVNPLETTVNGYTALYNRGPDGLAVGGCSARNPDSLREFSGGTAAVTNMRRARWIAREFHDWNVRPEHKLNHARMRGDIPA